MQKCPVHMQHDIMLWIEERPGDLLHKNISQRKSVDQERSTERPRVRYDWNEKKSCLGDGFKKHNGQMVKDYL